ncbi:MAG: hypothetical protein ACKPKF_26120 [Microcystis panniformis]
MLKNLFGGKKSDFYLELKETDGEQQATATTAAAAPVVEAPAAAVEPAAVPVAEKKTKKTSVKKEKQVKETPAAPVSAPAPVAATNGKVEPQEVEFATKYLITPSMSRRRPGPSLNGFKDMARKAKLPANRG